MPTRERLLRSRRRLRRAVLRRRRLLAAVLTGVAVLAGVRAVAAPPPATVPVLVVARDLPAGTLVADGDLHRVAFRPGSVPAGVETDPAGRRLAGPVRRGEPLTDARLVGAGLAEGLPGRRAAPVRLPDAAMAALIAPGDRVDLVAADPQGGPAEVVAADALVLAVPPPPADAGADALPGRVVVLALAPAEVVAVSAASVTHFLTVAFSG